MAIFSISYLTFLSKIWSHKKSSEGNISPIHRDAPNGMIIFNFGIWGDISDVIIHIKICINPFDGFGDISIGLAGRSYNSVSTAVLHCENSAAACTSHTILLLALLNIMYTTAYLPMSFLHKQW